MEFQIIFMKVIISLGLPTLCQPQTTSPTVTHMMKMGSIGVSEVAQI